MGAFFWCLGGLVLGTLFGFVLAALLRGAAEGFICRHSIGLGSVQKTFSPLEVLLLDDGSVINLPFRVHVHAEGTIISFGRNNYYFLPDGRFDGHMCMIAGLEPHVAGHIREAELRAQRAREKFLAR